MVETIQIGQSVPDFEMEAYFPQKKDFGKISLQEVKSKKNKITVKVNKTNKSCKRKKRS